jgi:hypothetical protein
MIINSPQAPGDIMPVPWEQRGLADVGIKSAPLAFMASEGVFTLLDLELWLQTNSLIKVKGIGEKSVPKIMAAFDAYREIIL